MRLADEIDEATFAAKQTELRDRLSKLKLQTEVLDRSHDEYADLASRVFELSQSLTDKWLTADVLEKRQILEIVFLNCTLDDATLCPTIRKPFDVLAEGLISKNSRGAGFEKIHADGCESELCGFSSRTRLECLSFWQLDYNYQRSWISWFPDISIQKSAHRR